MIFHSTDVLLFSCTPYLYSIAVLSLWVDAANGAGTTDLNFYFGLGSGFMLVFLKQNLVRKSFDSDQLPEQVHRNTSQTNTVATWTSTGTRVLCTAASICSLKQVTVSKSQEEQPSHSLVLQRKFIRFIYIRLYI